VGPELGAADAFATAALAMGSAGPRWTASLSSYEAMTILDDGRVLTTPGFLSHCPGGSPAASLAAA
jgi:FAD:protein FMN transferase